MSDHSTLPRNCRWAIGKNCLFELLRTAPERVVKVYAANPFDCGAVPIKIVKKEALSELVGSSSHQGYAAIVKERTPMTLEALLQKTAEKERALIVAIDSVQDPQNLGALLRAAECFGADAVIWSKNRGVGITPAVTKAGVGATELVEVIKVSNLVEAVKKLKKGGFWAVAAEVGERSEPLDAFTSPEKCLLIVGSEGEGIRPLLSRQADFHLHIPMKGRIDSLNVSQATAVFLYNLSCDRKK